MSLYLTALLVYSLILMAIGIGASRRVKTSADFLVAGRRLGPGLVFASFFAANIGAGSTVGAAGLGYRFGLSAWWWVGSAGIGTLVLSQLLGPRLWRIARQHNLSTLQDYLELRYGKSVKAIVAVLFWCGSLAILAGQLIAMSWILATVAGLPKTTSCVIGGLVAIVYTASGGLVSSTFVNILEIVVTMTGLLLAVPFALHSVGGWQQLQTTVALSHPQADLFSITGAGLKQILVWVAILIPSFIVSPGLLQKLYGARSTASVRIGIGLNSIGQLLFAFVPPILGLCALAAMPHMTNPELALPAVLKLLLPRWLSVLALASIFSAELSSTGAILFMLSTSLSVDLYKTFLRPDVSPRGLLTASRVASVGAGVAGILAAIALPSIIAAISIFYSLIAVALFVPVLAGLYTKRVLKPAAIASIVCAVAVTVAVMILTNNRGVGVLSPPAIGILTAAVVTVGFTLFARRQAATQEQPHASS
jgi:SSS family solute:Na+ symporter